MLGNVLTAIKQQESFKTDDATIAVIVDKCTQLLNSSGAVGADIVLERGVATIPLPGRNAVVLCTCFCLTWLPGIDVPFHSRFLTPGVPAFRSILQQRLHPSTVDALSLVGRYVPNVTAVPFALGKTSQQIQ